MLKQPPDNAEPVEYLTLGMPRTSSSSASAAAHVRSDCVTDGYRIRVRVVSERPFIQIGKAVKLVPDGMAFVTSLHIQSYSHFLLTF